MTIPANTFKVDNRYTRADVFDAVGLSPHPVGGDWFTGYTYFNGDGFIFCHVGTAGRTGHDYGNKFENGLLYWRGKTNSTLSHTSVKHLLAPKGRTYVFYRSQDRSPFTFAGIGTPVRTENTRPVTIWWALGERVGERLFPDEVESESFIEGAKRTVTVNAFERAPRARAVCIKYWGCKCVVCAFDFSVRYGPIGEGFIHVHHIKPLSEIGKDYVLDPIRDLRPVCPNCHAMLHRLV
ncbi:MAG: HNH endonuclease, partial [Burkholderiaceae bacterium]|nr:HNH endonuclease [Burkholderiaceae bacterium]